MGEEEEKMNEERANGRGGRESEKAEEEEMKRNGERANRRGGREDKWRKWKCGRGRREEE